MAALFSLTLVTGLTDSLNPFGIAQQFILQGLIKKARDIWYYILSMLATNFAAGVLFYAAMTLLSDQLLSRYWTVLETPVVIGALVLGLVLAWYSIRLFLINWRSRKNLNKLAAEEEKELEEKLAGRSLSPAALVKLGVITTLMELSTAAPYIAYLALIQSYELNAAQFLLILFFYNILYSLPLIIMYLLFVFFKEAFDRLYKKLQSVLQVVEAFLAPTILLIIGALLVGFGLTSLL